MRKSSKTLKIEEILQSIDAMSPEELYARNAYTYFYNAYQGRGPWNYMVNENKLKIPYDHPYRQYYQNGKFNFPVGHPANKYDFNEHLMVFNIQPT